MKKVKYTIIGFIPAIRHDPVRIDTYQEEFIKWMRMDNEDNLDIHTENLDKYLDTSIE